MNIQAEKMASMLSESKYATTIFEMKSRVW